MILANHLHMPSYCLKTFTECPQLRPSHFIHYQQQNPSHGLLVSKYRNKNLQSLLLTLSGTTTFIFITRSIIFIHVIFVYFSCKT